MAVTPTRIQILAVGRRFNEILDGQVRPHSHYRLIFDFMVAVYMRRYTVNFHNKSLYKNLLLSTYHTLITKIIFDNLLSFAILFFKDAINTSYLLGNKSIS